MGKKIANIYTEGKLIDHCDSYKLSCIRLILGSYFSFFSIMGGQRVVGTTDTYGKIMKV